LLLPVLAVLFAALGLEAYGRRGPGSRKWDAIIVAGAAVWPGGVASPALRRRVEYAAKLWFDGVAPLLVLTGGVGRHPPSEARVSGEILLDLGVPQDVIHLEESSTTTDENAAYALLVCRAAGLTEPRVLVVTDAYHAFRCRRVFRRRFANVRAIGVVGALRWRIKGCVRELGAILVYWLQGLL